MENQAVQRRPNALNDHPRFGNDIRRAKPGGEARKAHSERHQKGRRAAKSSQTRHIPLNSEAADALRRWKKQSSKDRIFPFTGFKTTWSALLEQATIKAFRWHDMRHDFASRLASKGVPLNTVRELLGHQSLVMTLRYAHLQPDRKAEAVSRLAEL